MLLENKDFSDIKKIIDNNQTYALIEG